MAKTAIKKMVIELNGKDVELTMEQARELQSALNELFGEKVREIIKPQPYPYPVPDPYPVIPWRRRPYWEWREPFYKCLSGTRFQVTSDNEVVRCQLKSG